MSHVFVNRYCARLILAASFAVAINCQPAVAEDPIDDAFTVATTPVEIPSINTGNWSFNMGVDVVTEYWFRGISQGRANTRGFIPQLYMDAAVQLFENDDFSIAFNVGSWNSFTSSNSSTGPGSGGWYEADIYSGFTFGLPADLSLDVAYVLLYGPSGGAEFAQEIDVTLAWDDGSITQEQLGLPFSFQPYVMAAFEVSGASDGVGNGGDSYLEFGIEPSLIFVESEDYPITIAFPVVVGCSLDDYYQPGNNFLGYVDVGIVFSVPLSFIPTEYGAWEASAGVHFLYLDSDTRRISRAAGTSGNSTQIIGIMGVSMSY